MSHTNEGEKIAAPQWKTLFFSPTLTDQNKSRKIAYVAVVTALVVVANMFFEFKFAEVQFSLTIFFSALAGLIIGPLFGAVACFLGDLVGFLYNSGGYAYLPWIGISMAFVALISGLVVSGLPLKCRGGLQIKLAIVCVLTFLLCTVAINTTAFWLLYANGKGVPYGTYLINRLFVQGQIWNSVFNYGLLFVAVPVLSAIKPLGIHVA